MKFPRLASPRTIISAIRTMVYGTFAAVFAMSETDARQFVDAAVIGGVFADYITWLIRSVAFMPGHILHGCYEGLVNLAFGWFFSRYVQTDVGSNPNSLATAFLAFMIVLGVKTFFYMTDYLSSITEDK